MQAEVSTPQLGGQGAVRTAPAHCEEGGVGAESELTPGPQHTCDFRNGAVRVSPRHSPVIGEHNVERPRHERQGLRIGGHEPASAACRILSRVAELSPGDIQPGYPRGPLRQRGAPAGGAAPEFQNVFALDRIQDPKLAFRPAPEPPRLGMLTTQHAAMLALVVRTPEVPGPPVRPGDLYGGVTHHGTAAPAAPKPFQARPPRAGRRWESRGR